MKDILTIALVAYVGFFIAALAFAILKLSSK